MCTIMHVLYYWYSIYGSTSGSTSVLGSTFVQRTRTYGNRTEIDILFPEVRRYSSCTTTCTVSYFVRVLPEVLSYFRTVGLHVLSCTVHTRSVQYQLSMIVVLSVHVQ